MKKEIEEKQESTVKSKEKALKINTSLDDVLKVSIPKPKEKVFT